MKKNIPLYESHQFLLALLPQVDLESEQQFQEIFTQFIKKSTLFLSNIISENQSRFTQVSNYRQLSSPCDKSLSRNYKQKDEDKRKKFLTNQY